MLSKGVVLIKGVHLCRHPSAMLCVLWLGSSVGNLKPDEAVGFFRAMQSSGGDNTQVPLLPLYPSYSCPSFLVAANYTGGWGSSLVGTHHRLASM